MFYDLRAPIYLYRRTTVRSPIAASPAVNGGESKSKHENDSKFGYEVPRWTESNPGLRPSSALPRSRKHTKMAGDSIMIEPSATSLLCGWGLTCESPYKSDKIDDSKLCAIKCSSNGRTGLLCAGTESSDELSRGASSTPLSIPSSSTHVFDWSRGRNDPEGSPTRDLSIRNTSESQRDYDVCEEDAKNMRRLSESLSLVFQLDDVPVAEKSQYGPSEIEYGEKETPTLGPSTNENKRDCFYSTVRVGWIDSTHDESSSEARHQYMMRRRRFNLRMFNLIRPPREQSEVLSSRQTMPSGIFSMDD